MVLPPQVLETGPYSKRHRVTKDFREAYRKFEADRSGSSLDDSELLTLLDTFCVMEGLLISMGRTYQQAYIQMVADIRALEAEQDRRSPPIFDPPPVYD